jgi:hypothetical protein
MRRVKFVNVKKPNWNKRHTNKQKQQFGTNTKQVDDDIYVVATVFLFIRFLKSFLCFSFLITMMEF